MDRMVMVLNLYLLPSCDGSKFIFIAIAFLLRASGDGSKFIFIAIAFFVNARTLINEILPRFLRENFKPRNIFCAYMLMHIRNTAQPGRICLKHIRNTAQPG